MKDDYYRLRGWDVTSGLPTSARLQALGLEDVARDLGAQGLAV
jgi:aldehyde:ferredoxin oxidoreductase